MQKFLIFSFVNFKISWILELLDFSTLARKKRFCWSI